MYNKLLSIVKLTIRNAIEGQLQPEVRYQGYADQFIGNVKLACRILTEADYSKETHSSITEKKSTLLQDFDGLRKSVNTEIGMTKTHPLSSLQETYIEPLCAFLNKQLQPLILELQTYETNVEQTNSKMTQLNAILALARQIPSNEAALPQKLAELSKLTESLETRAGTSRAIRKNCRYQQSAHRKI